jgi:Ca2+-binding RTX toxin-like protein
LYGRDGDDYLAGLAGDDWLFGGNGSDYYAGDAGNDRFVFNSVSAAGVGDTMDAISDFTAGEDKIDLSMIDAMSGVAGNQAFSDTLVFAFTGQKGQLMTAIEDFGLVLSGDVNGDSKADFQIRLFDVSSLSSADLIL